MSNQKKPSLKTVSISTEWIDHKGEEHLLIYTPEGTICFRHDDIAKMAAFFNKAAEYVKGQKVQLQ